MACSGTVEMVDLVVIRQLVEMGADVNKRVRHKGTHLVIAAEQGNGPLVELLIKCQSRRDPPQDGG